MMNDKNIQHINITLTTWFFLILCGFARSAAHSLVLAIKVGLFDESK
jgi:hypothetical protein